MDDQLNQLTEIVDIDKPSAARMYDYYLGGSHNFSPDRELADSVARAVPWVREVAVDNRAFLRRAVRFCVARGIRQFIDIGSGTPTVGSVHEIALRADPSCRVVCVDDDPVAVAHGQITLADEPRAAIVHADVREPETILGAPEIARLIDLDQPVAVLMVAVLHFIPECAELHRIVDAFRAAMAPGGYVVCSHLTRDAYSASMQRLADIYQCTASPLTLRTKAEFSTLFAGFDLVEPGVVWTQEWRPEHPDLLGEDPTASLVYAGVGRRVS